MAETITIPSPSVFLRASPDPPDPPTQLQDPTSERKRSTVKKKRTPLSTSRNVENAAVTKPKQSKSRNGMQHIHIHRSVPLNHVELFCQKD